MRRKWKNIIWNQIIGKDRPTELDKNDELLAPWSRDILKWIEGSTSIEIVNLKL